MSIYQHCRLLHCSEIEVVLDDGTLHKRTVSLSTLPDWQFSGFHDGDASEGEEDEGFLDILGRPDSKTSRAGMCSFVCGEKQQQLCSQFFFFLLTASLSLNGK